LDATAAILHGGADHPLLSATVDALAVALGLRDGSTGEHCNEVVELAVRLGERLQLVEERLRDLRYAARVHDIGKVGVPDAVLRKPGPLDEHERRVLERHASEGAELLARIPGFDRVALIVRHHHERHDGRGYPDGLEADEIPLESRILAVADSFVAMAENRPYRRALSPLATSRELRRGRGSQWDPMVVDALTAELRGF
jgi:HD-GYP domain-containing protein (c-di-GMP phosphodiesterase class II)